MFLVEHQRSGTLILVFTVEDPRKDGFSGTVVEGVTLDHVMVDVHTWPDGQESPKVVVGREPGNPKHYKVFKCSRELQAAGFFLATAGQIRVVNRWSDYT